MLKIIKKIPVILLLSIIFISNALNIVKAVYEIQEAYIEKIGQAPYHLKYYNENKGMYTYAICSIVGRYQDGKFYPAYCLNRDMQGVGYAGNYTVDVDNIIENNQIWRAVKNGYPYKIAVASISDEKEVLANGNLYIIDVDKTKANPYYLKAFFESEEGVAALKRISVGSVIPNIGLSSLKELEIPLPSLEEQNKVANRYLAIVDEITMLNHKLDNAVKRLNEVFNQG